MTTISMAAAAAVAVAAGVAIAAVRLPFAQCPNWHSTCKSCETSRTALAAWRWDAGTCSEGLTVSPDPTKKGCMTGM